MSNQINLLRSTKKRREESKKFLRIFQIISVCCLLIVSGVSFFIFFLNTTSSVPALQKEEDTLLSNFSSLRAKAVTLLLTKDRIKNIGTLVEKRSNFDTIVTKITQTVPPNVSVKSFSFDSKSVQMTVVSSSLFSLDTLFVNLTKVAKEKKITKITLEGISLDPLTGEYTVIVSLDVA